MSAAAATIVDRTSPVLDVGIEQECHICFEAYKNGAESCLRLKAFRHLVCKACIEKLDHTSNGLIRCPICRTSWLDDAAPRETHNAATQGRVDQVLDHHTYIDLTLDDDSTHSINGQHDEAHDPNEAPANDLPRACEQRVSRNRRWREFREALARQRAATNAHRQTDRLKENRNNFGSGSSRGRTERPRHGRLHVVRRSLLDRLSSSPFERLTQAHVLQEPGIDTEETHRPLPNPDIAQASQTTSSDLHTETSNNEPSHRGQHSAKSPRPIPRLEGGDLPQTEPFARAPRHHQDLQDGAVRSRTEHLERRRREVEARLKELHDHAKRPDHQCISAARSDTAFGRKEARLDERERQLVARENLAERHRVELQGVIEKQRDEAERVLQRHRSEMEEVLQRQRNEVAALIHGDAGEGMRLE